MDLGLGPSRTPTVAASSLAVLPSQLRAARALPHPVARCRRSAPDVSNQPAGAGNAEALSTALPTAATEVPDLRRGERMRQGPMQSISRGRRSRSGSGALNGS